MISQGPGPNDKLGDRYYWAQNHSPFCTAEYHNWPKLVHLTLSFGGEVGFFIVDFFFLLQLMGTVPIDIQSYRHAFTCRNSRVNTI